MSGRKFTVEKRQCLRWLAREFRQSGLAIGSATPPFLRLRKSRVATCFDSGWPPTRGGPWTLRTAERSKARPRSTKSSGSSKIAVVSSGRKSTRCPWASRFRISEEQAATMWTLHSADAAESVNTANARVHTETNRGGSPLAGRGRQRHHEGQNHLARTRWRCGGRHQPPPVFEPMLRGHNLDLPPTAPAIAGPRQRSCSLASADMLAATSMGPLSPAQRTVSSRRVRAEALGSTSGLMGSRGANGKHELG